MFAETLFPLRKLVGTARGMGKLGDHLSGEDKARKLQISVCDECIKAERGNDSTAKGRVQ